MDAEGYRALFDLAEQKDALESLTQEYEGIVVDLKERMDLQEKAMTSLVQSMALADQNGEALSKALDSSREWALQEQLRADSAEDGNLTWKAIGIVSATSLAFLMSFVLTDGMAIKDRAWAVGTPTAGIFTGLMVWALVD